MPCCRVTTDDQEFCPASEKNKTCEPCNVRQNSLQRPTAQDFSKYLPYFLKVLIVFFFVVVVVVVVVVVNQIEILVRFGGSGFIVCLMISTARDR